MWNHHVLIIIGALDISLETTRIQVGPEVTEEIVLITFLADKIAEETYESLSLQLAPTPATVQTMPMGEGVFFKQEIPLIITDIDCKFNNRLVSV